MKCKNCVFYTKGIEPDAGECHKRAPVTHFAEAGKVETVFPKVKKDSFCGEFDEIYHP